MDRFQKLVDGKDIFCPSVPANLLYNPDVRNYTLGDRYTETVPIGIQQNLKRYSLTWENVPLEVSTQIIEFFKKQRGFLTFRWRDPNNEDGLYKCYSWNERIRSGGYRSIEATFNEVSF